MTIAPVRWSTRLDGLKLQATGDRLDTDEIGFAYNFGKSDAPTSLMNPPWQQRMRDYYEEHGEPEEQEGGDDTEEEEEGDGAKTKIESAGGHKIQTRVSQAFLWQACEEAQNLASGRPYGKGYQGIQDFGPRSPSVRRHMRRPLFVLIFIRTAEIKIIGFMDPKNVRFELNVKNSIFLYPDEKVSLIIVP